MVVQRFQLFSVNFHIPIAKINLTFFFLVVVFYGSYLTETHSLMPGMTLTERYKPV